MNITQVKEEVDALDGFLRRPTSTDLMYNIRTLIEAYEALTTTYAPFRVGDRAELRKTPRIDKEHAWGWLGSKHFLVEGRLGTVRSVEFWKGKFRIGWEPDNQTFLDSRGTEVDLSEAATYCFLDSELVPERARL